MWFSPLVRWCIVSGCGVFSKLYMIVGGFFSRNVLSCSPLSTAVIVSECRCSGFVRRIPVFMPTGRFVGGAGVGVLYSNSMCMYPSLCAICMSSFSLPCGMTISSMRVKKCFKFLRVWQNFLFSYLSLFCIPQAAGTLYRWRRSLVRRIVCRCWLFVFVCVF